MNEVVIALKQDIDLLLNAYNEKFSLRFEDFYETWNLLNFSLIFCGKTTKTIDEFTENLFQTLTSLLVEEISIQRRVGALYCLYCSYFIQPCIPKIKIRLTVDNLKPVYLLIDELRNNQHFDALYIFSYLHSNSVLQITQFPIKYDYWSFLPYISENCESETTDQVIRYHLEDFTRDFITNDMQINKVINMEKEYDDVKSKIKLSSETETTYLFKNDSILSDELKTITHDFVNSISHIAEKDIDYDEFNENEEDDDYLLNFNDNLI